MFKSKYRDQIISSLNELVFLSSYDKNLVGICLYGYVDSKNELELIRFYKNVDKENREVYGNTYHVGDTYIKCANLDIERYGSFVNEIFRGVIVYDPMNALFKPLTHLLSKYDSSSIASNEITFDNEFANKLIDCIISDMSKPKTEEEKNNSLYNIYNNIVECKRHFKESEYALFLSTTNFYNKLFMDDDEAKLHYQVLNNVLTDHKNNKILTKKK